MRNRVFLITLIVATLAHDAAIRAAAARTGQSEPSLAPIVRTERAGAGVIRVVYDLAGAPGATFSVALEASNDGGQTFAVRPRALTGDVGANVSPGTGKAVVWDSTKDTEDLQIDRYVFRVIVSRGGVVAAAPQAAPAAPAARGGSSGARGAAPGSRGGAATSAPKSGGLSKGAIIAITGGAAAAGVGVAVAKGGGASTTPSTPSSPSTPTTPPPVTRTLSGSITGTLTWVGGGCTRGESGTGTITLRLVIASDGTVTGTTNGTVINVVSSLSSSCVVGGTQTIGASDNTGFGVTPVTGTTSRLVFTFTASNSIPGGETRTNEWSFTGSLASDVVTGTLDLVATTQTGRATGGYSVTAR
jgi:hypothetical protein